MIQELETLRNNKEKIKEIKQTFFDSIKKGTGKAYLILNENPNIDFSRYIIKASINNYAYNAQSEGSRADYIFGLISISKNKKKIRSKIFEALINESFYFWNLTHLFELVKLFAQSGDKEAKDKIYERFCNKIIDGNEDVGSEEIIELDGLKGFIYVVNKLGNYIRENNYNWDYPEVIFWLEEFHPNYNVLEILQKEAKENKNISYFLNIVNQSKNKISRKINFDYNSLLNEIETSKRSFISPRYCRKLTKKQIKELANMFLREKEISKKERILCGFRFVKYPYNIDPIIKIAKRKNTNQNRLKEFALYSLRLLENKKVRSLSLSKILHSNSPSIYIDLLIENYQEGDYLILKKVIQKFNNKHIIEGISSSICSIYEKNQTKECTEPLLELYNKTNCGMHRSYIVKILIENDVLPNYIKKEIEFDCYEDTRNLYKKIKFRYQ